MHWLVTGITRCGKSRLMKEVIIPAHRKAGRWVGVLDPVGAGDWTSNWVTSDPERFVAASRQARGCVFVVDEVAKYRANYKAITALEEMFYMTGNYGNLCYALAQRMMMVPPNIRDQCSQAVVFQQTSTSLALLAEQYNQPRIMEAVNYPKGTGMMVEPFQEPRVFKLF